MLTGSPCRTPALPSPALIRPDVDDSSMLAGAASSRCASFTDVELLHRRGLYIASDARHACGPAADAVLDLDDITSCRKTDSAPRAFLGRNRLSAIVGDW